MISLAYRLRQIEDQLTIEKAQARRQSLQNFSEQLVADGKIALTDQGGIVDFLCSLPEDQADYFQEFLGDRPKVEEFAMPIEVQIAYSRARSAYESGWRK